MLRRTVPAVSFTTSHRALMYRSSRPLLGGHVNSIERAKAAWDETPFTLLGMSRKEINEWNFKVLYHLCLRDVARFSKIRVIANWVGLFAMGYLGSQTFGIMFLYRNVFGLPEYMKKENSREYARAHGADVWAADGKFIRPYFHINPPMLTMTTDEL